MSLFCLVHGSTENAAGWDLLVPELESQGQRAVRAELPTDDPQADAGRYADAILSAIPADAEDVLLVGHSGSGYLLPLVAAQRSVRRMVFLAAMLPEIGKSFLEQLRADPTILNPEWIGKDPSRDDRAAIDFLFHDCPPEVAKWALTTLIRLPLERVANEVYPLQEWPGVASSYIVCSQDRTINAEWSRRTARERLGVNPIELESGHCPHVSQPKKLAKILSDLT
ncbi:MAG: alpha/beta hydrolase [Acidobacteria bacterium]|nr:MAG: alpha/beta hydrolase [Acidobacteriota bacterium]